LLLILRFSSNILRPEIREHGEEQEGRKQTVNERMMRLVWCLEMMVEEVWEAVEKYGIWFVRRAFVRLK